MSAGTASNAGWRGYWKADRPASCMPETPATAQEIAKCWQAWLAALPAGSRILDVATGNGIVLVHATVAARSLGTSFQLTGVDLADIDPVRHVANLDAELRGATFLGGVAAERLPFGACSFDAVVSQYGLEYADIDRALAEVERVLAPGGALYWLAHSADSEVVAQHRHQALEVEFLLSPEGPVHVMNSFVTRLRKHKDTQYSMNALQASLAQAEVFCREHPPAKVVVQVCGGFADIARRGRAYDARELGRMMREAERRLAAHRLRIQDLLAAVLTPPRLEVARERLAGPAWRDFAVSRLCVGSPPCEIGVRIVARRREAR